MLHIACTAQHVFDAASLCVAIFVCVQMSVVIFLDEFRDIYDNQYVVCVRNICIVFVLWTSTGVCYVHTTWMIS